MVDHFGDLRKRHCDRVGVLDVSHTGNLLSVGSAVRMFSVGVDEGKAQFCTFFPCYYNLLRRRVWIQRRLLRFAILSRGHLTVNKQPSNAEKQAQLMLRAEQLISIRIGIFRPTVPLQSLAHRLAHAKLLLRGFLFRSWRKLPLPKG